MHPLSHFHYKRIHSPSGECPTACTPTPDPTMLFSGVASPTRDPGTQLARGINWIQSSSLQAKKMSHPTQSRWIFVFSSLPLPSNLPAIPSSAPPSATEPVRSREGSCVTAQTGNSPGKGTDPGDRATPIVMSLEGGTGEWSRDRTKTT